VCVCVCGWVCVVCLCECVCVSVCELCEFLCVCVSVSVCVCVVCMCVCLSVCVCVLQIGRLMVRCKLVSLTIFMDIKSFRSHYGPGVDSASNRNQYQEHFPGIRAAGA